MIPIQFKLLRPDAKEPTRNRAGDAAFDLYSVASLRMYDGEVLPIATGVAVALPEGYAGLIVGRSGLAVNSGVDVLGGMIDPNYRGELKVVIHKAGHAVGNSDDKGYLWINHGDRIGQLLVVPFWALDSEVVDELPVYPDDRGVLGFGSSGR